MNDKPNYLAIGVIGIALIGVVIIGYLLIKPKDENGEPTGAKDDLNLVAGVDENIDQIKGPKNAQVTIVSYSDFECPACSFVALQVLPQVEDYYKEKVRLVYRHFPLSYHPNAKTGAWAAEAAGKQGKFFEMHDEIFKNQNSLDKNAFNLFAKNIGLDLDKFKADMELQEIKDKVNQDKEGGEELGIDGTPTLYVNGQKYVGNLSFEDLQLKIGSYLED